jgi:hypothetical protein
VRSGDVQLLRRHQALGEPHAAVRGLDLGRRGVVRRRDLAVVQVADGHDHARPHGTQLGQVDEQAGGGPERPAVRGVDVELDVELRLVVDGQPGPGDGDDRADADRRALELTAKSREPRSPRNAIVSSR